MALIKPSPIVEAISGSLDAITFKITRAGMLATSRPRGTRNKTSLALESDARFTTLCNAWHDLTSLQRLAWTSFARNLPSRNRLGIPRALSGFQTFLAHNTPAYLARISLIPNPPPLTSLDPPIDPTVWFQEMATYRYMCTISAPYSPVYLITEGARTSRQFEVPAVKGAPPIPTWPFNSWTFLQITSLPTGSQTDFVTSAWYARIGMLALNTFFAVRASIWHPNALRSPRIITPNKVVT